jgi:hypothetical protein
MKKNSQGQLTAPERKELAKLVRETERIALDNARRLAGRK